ncbi:MAG: pentapeptide repeat-containing protein [Bacteroidales bacterium]|nr:pentapeptide repeat-containing protein [Bacteroidales bacterium]
MTTADIIALTATKELNDIDLSGITLEGLDFGGCTLTKVNFKGSTLRHCSFEEAVLDCCSFECSGKTDTPNLQSVSFKKATLINCRFRYANIAWSDFRYARIDQATFEDSTIDFCDFYRCFFEGVVLFKHAKISNSSLYYTYFGDATNLRRENLVDGRILQQNKKNYTKFLVDWHTYGTGVRTNDMKVVSDWSPDAAVKARWSDAEDIYKTLMGLWTQRGFNADANWGYVQGRRMERRRMMTDLTDKKLGIWTKIGRVWHIIGNSLSDLFFGYGESMFKMILTYIFTVLLFAFIFSSEVSPLHYLEALGISFKNMAGVDSEVLHDVSPLVDMLNLVQTTIGVLLTGIFGFILGNKIRNQ